MGNSLSIDRANWICYWHGTMKRHALLQPLIDGVQYGILGMVVLGILLGGSPVWSIEVNPTPGQITQAMDRGREAAKARISPDRMYAWFGSTKALAPHGFLMTKLAGLSVMASHFALRSEVPTHTDIDRVLQDDALLISVVIFGKRPDFAVDSYMVLTQGDRTIIPQKVRFDGHAGRSSAWPDKPAYRAKVIASVPYKDLDPLAHTTLTVFPGIGGEISLTLDFASIP